MGTCAYLGGTTAALYWRAVQEGRIASPAPSAITRVEDPISGYRELRDTVDLTPLGLLLTDHGALTLMTDEWVCVAITLPSGQETMRPLLIGQPTGIALPPGTLMPLNLLVAERSQRQASPKVRTIMLSGELPEGSFYRVSEKIVVSSPELTFMQCCLRHHLLPNIELGMEWCGSYGIAPSTVNEKSRGNPLTSTDRLAGFLDHTHLPAGAEAARRALRWIVDGMASPRETEVYLVLTLPPSLGGFGLPLPEVNAEIPLEGTAAAELTEDGRYIADFLYRKKRVMFEYDGKDDHEKTPSDIVRDKQRRSVLAALGYHVIVITDQDLHDLRRLRRKASQIAMLLGVKLPTFDREQQAAHKALTSWLFDSRHDHLPFGFGYR